METIFFTHRNRTSKKLDREMAERRQEKGRRSKNRIRLNKVNLTNNAKQSDLNYCRIYNKLLLSC